MFLYAPRIFAGVGSRPEVSHREALGRRGHGGRVSCDAPRATRPVALKEIVPQFAGNQEFAAGFKREAEAAGRLSHPNVVNVTDFGVTQVGERDLAYLVMEYFDTDESNPASKLLLHILAAVAQFERELMRERVSAGMKAAKVRGTKTGNAIGRPRRIFDRDEVVRLRGTGLSIEKIARQLNIGVGTVVRAVHACGGQDSR